MLFVPQESQDHDVKVKEAALSWGAGEARGIASTVAASAKVVIMVEKCMLGYFLGEEL
jgi:hypothetical protein